MYGNDVDFSSLAGKTLSRITNSGNEIFFETSNGERFRQTHHQECCESVRVEDVVGDLDDLLNTPILRAEERVNPPDAPPLPKDDVYRDDSATWTFYELATIKGSVTIRWYGTSNGYYSESVSFEKVS